MPVSPGRAQTCRLGVSPSAGPADRYACDVLPPEQSDLSGRTGRGRGARVALTFDVEDPDLPWYNAPSSVTTILDVLARSGVRATFFLQGRWVDANPEIARAVADAGHAIASHSYSHVDFCQLSAEGLAADLGKARDRITAVTGVDPFPWFRLPFGAGSDDRVLRRRLHRLGYRHVGWDVDPKDYERDRAEDVVAGALEGLDGCAGGDADREAVVLMHSWPQVTPRALEALCRSLVERGTRFVVVDELRASAALAVPERASALQSVSSRVRLVARSGR